MDPLVPMDSDPDPLVLAEDPAQGQPIGLQPRLQDVLHLIIWNGYGQDVRNAVASTRETWTDERCWYPYLIKQTVGPKKKNTIQLLMEHPRIFTEARLAVLEKMAADTYHEDLFQTALDVRDTDGESALTAGIRSKSFHAVKFLVERGADINQQNKKGRSALRLAADMVHTRDTVDVRKKVGKKIKTTQLLAAIDDPRKMKIYDYLKELGAVDIPEERQPRGIYHFVMANHHRMMANHNHLMNNYIAQYIRNNPFYIGPGPAQHRPAQHRPAPPGMAPYRRYTVPEPPPRLSKKEFKQQFASRR